MASEDYFLSFKEDNKCECTKNGSPSDSPNRLCKGIQSNSSNKVNNYSKCSSHCGSFQLDYSNDFHANASRKASSNSSSICSEQNNCGSSQNYYYEDFHTDSLESSSSNSSCCSSPSEQPETKEEELPKEKKGNDHQPKGAKTLPKKKQKQKTYFSTDSIINSQKTNNVARRLLSARLHKVKELKNEVSVLKNKLEASNMENQILKRLQYRHLKAISKYENAETNLPDLMAKQCGEVRTLRTLLRKSQEQERNASRKLRDVEAQLLKTKDTLQALQKLSEDKNLAERGELKHRLTGLTQRMENGDKRILEKERELGIRNIYANRMLKSQQDKADSETPPKGSIIKSVQVDIKLEAMTLQKHETEKSAVALKEELATKDINAKDKLCDMHKEMELKPEFHQTEKLPMQQVPNKTCTELLREEICLSAENYFKCENIERQKNRRERQGLDLLKEEFEKLRTEQSFQSNDVQQKENNLEKAVVQKQENEESKRGEEPKEVVYDKLATVIQRHRTPSKLKKQYVFTEAVENLHQGLPSTGPLSNTSTTCSSRQVNRHQGETAEFKAGDSVSAYEPSFGKVTKARQKDSSSTHGEDHIATVSMEKKNTLMEELFGPKCILKDSHPNPNLKEVGKEKTLQSEKTYDEISYVNDGLQCGDSKETHIKVFHTIAFLDNFK
ncbi:lebercilin-like protein isoform X1 [Elgaria multicarinata webbii]|uniref:lebercilin-like protein isoform X1 n=1 Tax=Elgaria multicarinata webbii TaxID=159646 RepID=UPI002FCCF35E